MATVPVSAGANLQAAIDAAVAGDVLELEAGATWAGNFSMPVHSGGEIVIQSSGVIPSSGTRVSPGSAAGFATIRANAGGEAAIRTLPAAADWTLRGLQLPGNPGAFGEIVTLGHGDWRVQTALSAVPQRIALQRCYIHGDATVGQKRGVGLNCGAVEVRDSYISDCKLEGQDSQALAGWNGPGPFTIVNNYLEGAGENVLFGGGTAASAALMPANLTFTDNLVAKVLAWRSQAWQVKNLFELKMLDTGTIDNNVFEYCWADAQVGIPILFTIRNEEGQSPFATIRNVRFTRNIVRHAGGGINILGRDYRFESGLLSTLCIRDNLFYDITQAWGGSARPIQIEAGDIIHITHNTFVTDQPSDYAVAVYLVNVPCSNLTVVDNILVRPPNFGETVKSASDTVALNALVGTAALDAFAAPYTFTNNAIVGGSGTGYPSGNFYPATLAAVGFTDLGGDDYELDALSPYKGAATDGDDIGARFATAAPDITLPGTPTTPSPANAAVDVALAAVLGWTTGGDTDTYDVALGITSSPPTVSSAQAGTSYTPAEALSPNQTYYWRVTAMNADGSTTGPLWSFTTDPAVVDPPPEDDDDDDPPPDDDSGGTGTLRCAVLAVSTVAGPDPVSQTVTFADADGPFVPKLIITQGGFCALNSFGTEAGGNPAFWLYDIGLANADQTWSAASGSGSIWPFHTFKAGSGSNGNYAFMDTVPGIFFGGGIAALGYVSAVSSGQFDITWDQKDSDGDSKLIVVLGGDGLVIDYGFAGGLGSATKTTVDAMVALLTMTTQATAPRVDAYGASVGAGGKAMGWGFDTKTSGRWAAAAHAVAFGGNYAALVDDSMIAHFDGAGAWVVNNAAVTDWSPLSYTVANGGSVGWGGVGFGGATIKSAAGTFVQKLDGTGQQRIETGVRAKWVKLVSVGLASSSDVRSGAAQLVVGWADANGGQVGWWVNETGAHPGPLVGARYLTDAAVLRFADTPSKETTTFTAVAEMVEVAADGSFTIDWTTNDNVARVIAWGVLGEAVGAGGGGGGDDEEEPEAPCVTQPTALACWSGAAASALGCRTPTTGPTSVGCVTAHDPARQQIGLIGEGQP